MPLIEVRVTFGAIWALSTEDRRQRTENRKEKRFMAEGLEVYFAAAGFGSSGWRAMNQPVVLWSSLK